MGERPRPMPDRQTERYWQGLLRKQLAVQFCAHCALHVHPSKPCCPNCLRTDLDWKDIDGVGVVVGTCTVAAPFVAGMSTPYVVLRVSFPAASGVELIGDLVGAGEVEVSIGAPVRVVYEEVDDKLVLAQFALTHIESAGNVP